MPEQQEEAELQQPSAPTRVAVWKRIARAWPMLWKYLFSRAKTVNLQLASYFNTTLWRISQIELAGLGFSLMQIGEWLFSISCWVLLGCLGFSRSLGLWGAQEERPTLVKWGGASINVVFCVLLIAITSLHKPDTDPWSNLLKLKRNRPSLEATLPQLSMDASSSPADYPPNTIRAGVKWESYYQEINLHISNNTETDIASIDVTLSSDLWVIGAVETESVCLGFRSWSSDNEGFVDLKDDKGRITQTAPLKIPNLSKPSTTRIICDNLPSHTSLSLAVVVVAYNHAYNGSFPNRMFTAKQAPKFLKVDGSYKASNTVQKVNRELDFNGYGNSKS